MAMADAGVFFTLCYLLSKTKHIMENKSKELKVAMAPEIEKGTYSNLAIISHSVSEFCVDFAQMLPGNPEGNAIVRQRIIMTPHHAKRLLAALMDNVQKYEKNFGTIALPAPADEELRGGTVPFDINPRGNA